MIELGSKVLFFIKLIIHAVAKCGETETVSTASARLFITLPKSRTRGFI